MGNSGVPQRLNGNGKGGQDGYEEAGRVEEAHGKQGAGEAACQPSGGFRVARTVAEASAMGMLAVMNGQLPLKHARAACAMGELAIKGVIADAEYEATGRRLVSDLPALTDRERPNG